MFKKLRTAYDLFKSEQPGSRFLKTHQRWNKSAGPATKVAIVLVGAVLVIAGFLLGLIPGVPGIVLGLLGLALIATCFRKMAVWMDRAEEKCRRWKQRWFGRSRKRERPMADAQATEHEHRALPWGGRLGEASGPNRPAETLRGAGALRPGADAAPAPANPPFSP